MRWGNKNGTPFPRLKDDIHATFIWRPKKTERQIFIAVTAVTVARFKHYQSLASRSVQESSPQQLLWALDSSLYRAKQTLRIRSSSTMQSMCHVSNHGIWKVRSQHASLR